MKIVKEHGDVRRLTEIAWYEDHEDRTESSEFRKVKKQLKGSKCFINNGRCEGTVEIHHNIIEYAAANGIDWDKVRKDYPNVSSVDDLDQMLPLCTKHHRKPGFGIHYVTYPIWILQKYMNEEALEDFENEVNEVLDKK